jgi:predicted AAA+ superfamily ATPase
MSDMQKKRYLDDVVTSDLQDKMVFIGGPRQVGKTSFATETGRSKYEKCTYLNWDSREDRQNILASRFNASATLLIFDEIHKYKQWKNYVKGVYDTYKGRFDILITGSARLDIYRKGGDSLMGRYHYYRLHPFSLAEALQIDTAIAVAKELTFTAHEGSREVFAQLFNYGGFPEPFLKRDERTLRRWHNQRIDRLVKEDIRDTENIRDLSALQVLVELLRTRVGSLLSLNSLREDLNVTHKTVSQWMDVLERFYYHFRLYPFSSTSIKSLRKEPKLYLWDWSEVSNEAARLENIVASHLLKFCHFLYDAHGHRADLFYLRDREGREVDFLVTIDNKPWFAVEVKTSDSTVSKHLRYFTQRLEIPWSYQVVGDGDMDFVKDGVRLMAVDRFLGALV